jgi:uncharacterized membrane-anchored protein YhcB (DUF1043 family)
VDTPWLTGLAALISGVAGVLLSIRRAKSKERKAVNDELHDVEGMLDTERKANIKCERDKHLLSLILARHNIPLPWDATKDEEPN